MFKNKMLKMIKSKIINIFPFLRELLLYLSLKLNKKNINEYKNRNLRVAILKYYSDKLKQKMEEINYQQGILVFDNKVYALSEGVFLNTKGNNRYFKVPGGCPGNQGREMYNFLISRNIQVNTMIDLGANLGEITLYFCKQNPKIKILAVEASPENFEILKSNCKFQYFFTDNIILVNEAVSDQNGEIEISSGLGSENTIMLDGSFGANVKRKKVKAETLVALLERYNLDSIDFLKIDIEGSEPLLYGSLIKIISGIKSLIIEISHENRKDYFPLIELFIKSGMNCFLSDGAELSSDKIFNYIMESTKGVDLWFIKEQTNNL